MDDHTFKAAMSRWATGITVITTGGPDARPSGFTASSFSSLSLHPPMVLFCLGQDSTNLEAFQAAEGFVVNILGAGQEPLSTRFAARGGDKFAGLDYTVSRRGVPILPGCLATLECRVAGRYPGGDHLVFLGEVEEAQFGEGEPLLYFRGGYHRL